MKKVLLAVLTLIPCLALAAPGAYVSANAGINAVDPDVSGISTATGFIGGVAAGYLWGDQTLDYGLELDGTYYPNTTGNTSVSGLNSDFDGYNISLLGVLKYISCSTGFVGFAKAGAAYVNQTISFTAPGATFGSATGDMIAPEAALGVGYQFNQNVEMDLTADAVFADSGNSWLRNSSYKPAQNGSLMLGLTYTFA